MVKPNLKPNGKSVSAVWIDEQCGMVVKHPTMQTIIASGNQLGKSSIVAISTPKQPFLDHMIDYKYWHWVEFTVKVTPIGRLLYE